MFHSDTIIPSVQRVNYLRYHKTQNYSHMNTNIMHHTLAQYSLNKGLQL